MALGSAVVSHGAAIATITISITSSGPTAPTTRCGDDGAASSTLHPWVDQAVAEIDQQIADQHQRG